MLNTQRLKNDILALALLAFALFVALSLASFDPADPPSTQVLPIRVTPINLCGEAGAVVALRLRQTLGLGAWFALLTLIAYDLRLFAREQKHRPAVSILGSAVAIVACSAAIHVCNPGLPGAPEAGSGGYIGALTAATLVQYVTLPGVLLLLITAIVAGTMVSPTADLAFGAGRFLASPMLAVASTAGAIRRSCRRERVSTADVAEEDDWDTDEDDFPALTRRERVLPVNRPQTVTPPTDPAARAERESDFWQLPDLDILEDAEEFPYELLAKKAQESAETLERAFKEFGLNVRVVAADTGPVITQFELELDTGLRLNKVTALADDLAIKLRVPSVRVVASIPGKNTVGIEVPNEKQVMVRMRELIETSGQQIEKMAIPVFAGKDVSGQPLVLDMARMPHLLIAGRTGTGKSVCLNTLILSMLMTRTPDEVKMLMIDPKMVELNPYKRVPHLMHPVITDMKKAEAVLAWAVDKMEERYDLLARAGVRHLSSYNKLGREEIHQRLGINGLSEDRDEIPVTMPYIVIIADEMADMMMTCGKDVETHISRLAGKARAVGIHLVLATQKPTVDVVTGLIKSNLPARISFQVASKTDSRVVLDENGAEKLLGCGDMLYLAPGTSNTSRAQGTFVSDDEVNEVIDFYADWEPEYSDEIAKLSLKQAGGAEAAARRNDDLYNSAIEIVIREQRGSVSMIQSKLGIGYGRAARLIGYMAEDGIVGDHNGSNAREVLFTPEQWEAVQAEGDEHSD